MCTLTTTLVRGVHSHTLTTMLERGVHSHTLTTTLVRGVHSHTHHYASKRYALSCSHHCATHSSQHMEVQHKIEANPAPQRIQNRIIAISKDSIKWNLFWMISLTGIWTSRKDRQKIKKTSRKSQRWQWRVSTVLMVSESSIIIQYTTVQLIYVWRLLLLVTWK